MPHRANRQEIIFVTLSIGRTCFKQFSTGFSSGAYNGIFSADIHYMLDNFFPTHRVIILIHHFFIIRKCAFTNNKSHIFSVSKNCLKLLHSRLYLFISRIFINDERFDTHVIQQLNSNFPLINMLRLIVNTRFASPTNYKYNRNRIDLIIQQGCNRIDNITFPRILHIHYRSFTGCKMIPRSKCSTIAFIGSNNMMLLINSILFNQVITQCLQLRIRDTCIKIRPNDFNKFLYFHSYDHSFPLRSKAPKGMKHKASIAASRNLLEYA